MCQRDSHRDQQEETQLLFLRNLATDCPNSRLQPQHIQSALLNFFQQSTTSRWLSPSMTVTR
ncbi:hypothetical protein T08_14866 [Trichinella sp. T8]|nr:hypothetical protein T08_14866 [Trichinella sp. T8]